MPGIAANLAFLVHLYHFAQVHHSDAVGYIFDHAQIVRKKEVAQPEIVLQTIEQV
jgi:hypothetical protein